MPAKSILELFTEDELEDYLDVDRNLNPIWESYETMSFPDFERLIIEALKRLSGDDKPAVEMVIVGEREYDTPLRVCFVNRKSITRATLAEVTSIPELEPSDKKLLETFRKKYFPSVSLGWMLWGITV